LTKESRERPCGKEHTLIEDAIRHARENLGITAESDQYDKYPIWGTMKNLGWVIGFEITSRRRWRLDYDPKPTKEVHVNEEDYDRNPSFQKVAHPVKIAVGGDAWVRTYWHKWTTRYGVPGRGVRCSLCQAWHEYGRCPKRNNIRIDVL
jgi:hypothetical protein